MTHEYFKKLYTRCPKGIETRFKILPVGYTGNVNFESLQNNKELRLWKRKILIFEK